MIASHNEQSISKVLPCGRGAGLSARQVVQKMSELQIERNVYFGQLLGMCDHVTYMLGAHKFKAYKYVPYGPVDEVMPYLIRRAEENSDLLGGSVRECELLKGELKRRIMG